jgi:hypothetical protein
VREFMAAREFLILPVTQVPPFDVYTPYVPRSTASRRPISTGCTFDISVT